MASDQDKAYRFATDLWDGFDVVTGRTESGLQACKDALTLLKKRSELEMEYSKKLSKLATSPLTRRVMETVGGSSHNIEAGSCGFAWSSYLDACLEEAQAHADSAAALEETVVASLTSFIKDMEAARKTIVMDGQKRLKEKKEAEDAVAKAKAAYFKAADNHASAVMANDAAVNNPAAKTKDVNKAKAKMAKTKAALEQAVQEYEFQIKDSNGVRAKFLSRHMPKILDDLQHIETVRIHILKTNLRKTARILEGPPPRCAKALLTMKGAVAGIDNDTDMRTFITENKTYQHPPQPFEFEEHGSVASSSKKRSKQARETGAPETCVYGVTLEEVLRKSCAYLQEEPNMPKLLPVLCGGILALDGPRTEGVFRLSAESKLVKDLKSSLDSGNYDISAIDDVHVLTGALKLWFRELKEPLIPDSFYDSAVACNTPADAASLYADLSTPRQTVIRYLAGFLSTLSSPEIVNVTKMTPDNLAMIFAPSMLRCNDPALMMVNAENERLFVKALFEHLSSEDATHAFYQSISAAVPSSSS